MLDLGNFVDVLEGNLAAALVAGTHRAAEAVLSGLDIGGVQQEVGGGRGAQIKSEGSVGTDGDARRNWDTDIDVSSACVIFLKQSVNNPDSGMV